MVEVENDLPSSWAKNLQLFQNGVLIPHSHYLRHMVQLLKFC